jgi:hypothetical protein
MVKNEKNSVFQNFIWLSIFGHFKNVHFSKPFLLFEKNLLLKNMDKNTQYFYNHIW